MAVAPKYGKELLEAIEKQPPLSWRDRGIWLFGMTASWAACAGVYILSLTIPASLREAHPEALAVQQTMAGLWCIPLMVLLIGLGALCLEALYLRVAIFGKAGSVYSGSTGGGTLGYPLLMDLTDAPENVVKKVRKVRREFCYTLLALAVCLYLFSWCWNGREVIHPDGRVTAYSSLGTVKAEYTPDQVERLALRISEPYSSHDSQQYHELDFMIRFTNGKYYQFYMDDRTGDDLRYLQQLLALKEHFGPEIVRVEDAELLPDLIRDQNWTGEAKAMAQNLFQALQKEK